MKSTTLCLSLFAAVALNWFASADAAFVVEDGRPNAEIVIAENPPRMVKLAASELRDYLAKITGAELPIVSKPSDAHPVAIYVGRSVFTDELGVTDEGLRYGAYRMASGPDWLALVGRDFDFEPPEPSARNHGDQERAQKAWEEISGGHWINPVGSLYKDYHRGAGIWMHDEGGSLNAVYGWLRSLGVRWYMAGDTVYGERVQTILDELPAAEELRIRLEELARIGDPRADARLVVGQVAGPDTEWADYPLVTLRGGEEPDVTTTFRVGWDRDAVYFDVRCSEPDMEGLAVAENVWGGDSVAILIETQYHYRQKSLA